MPHPASAPPHLYTFVWSQPAVMMVLFVFVFDCMIHNNMSVFPPCRTHTRQTATAHHHHVNLPSLFYTYLPMTPGPAIITTKRLEGDCSSTRGALETLLLVLRTVFLARVRFPGVPATPPTTFWSSTVVVPPVPILTPCSAAGLPAAQHSPPG